MSEIIRASDAERERLIRELGEHYSLGRLSLAEFADRSDKAIHAQTRADLASLTGDLPVVDAATVTRPDKRTRTRRTIAALSYQARRGRWLLAKQTSAIAFMGKCQLDLRGARLDAAPTGDIRIRAWSFFGLVELIVPEGVNVELEGFALFGKHDSNEGEHGPVPGLPTVHVSAFSLFGAVKRFTGKERKILQQDQKRLRQ